MQAKYLFQSDRLGFRNWESADLLPFSQLNQDPAVMQFFPKVLSTDQSAAFIKRMQQMYEAKKYCYFAVDRLSDKTFIGFIGLAWQEYEAPFTPCVDIGWRLAKAYWGQGFASEGARRCLQYSFKTLQLTNIKAFAPVLNQPSIQVMKKIGMQEQMRLQHPALKDYPELVQCVCYEINHPG
jgi:RimJ/RimL family protein N-acetyltransferase